MTFVLLFCMLLFLGFCAVILVMGISDIYGNKKSENPIAVTTPRANSDNRDSRS